MNYHIIQRLRQGALIKINDKLKDNSCFSIS